MTWKETLTYGTEVPTAYKLDLEYGTLSVHRLHWDKTSWYMTIANVTVDCWQLSSTTPEDAKVEALLNIKGKLTRALKAIQEMLDE